MVHERVLRCLETHDHAVRRFTIDVEQQGMHSPSRVRVRSGAPPGLGRGFDLLLNADRPVGINDQVLAGVGLDFEHELVQGPPLMSRST